ncbi:MAG TPA: hypothetical protein VGT98_05380 [Candidatus Elarobacter sp.]|nr:hypothetical protein [Candidatus Elarobacter sp.]
MVEQSDFDDSIRREERVALHSELLARAAQKGLTLPENSRTDQLADLLSEIDRFETAVERAGGDLMVDSPDSSEPERPEFVLPHMHDNESLAVYIDRVRTATERLGPMALD